jgi:two-component system, OmpR family, response regulator ChvI
MTISLERNAVSATSKAARFSGSEAAVIRILLVDDNQYYYEALARELSEHGFTIQRFSDGASLLGALDTAMDADVIVLDWDLPKSSGLDVLNELRRQGVALPVILLAGQALPAHESLALDRGASDFIRKSRGVGVLIRRLRNVVNAADQPRSDKAIICGKLVIRPAISRAYWNEVDVGLTLGEYNIVHLLASNVGRHVSYDAIYDRVRRGGFIGRDGKGETYRRNVRTLIKRIRKKFRECDSGFDKIENYNAFGYCWKKAAT